MKDFIKLLFVFILGGSISALLICCLIVASDEDERSNYD